MHFQAPPPLPPPHLEMVFASTVPRRPVDGAGLNGGFQDPGAQQGAVGGLGMRKLPVKSSENQRRWKGTNYCRSSVGFYKHKP